MSQRLSFARAWMAAVTAVMLVAACHPLSPDSERDKKPGTPVSLEIAASGGAKPGEVGDFTVTATILADGMLTLDVDLPEGFALYSGDLHQHGPAHTGTQYRLFFSVRVPETGSRTITATARLQRAEGGFVAKDTYVIGGSENKPVTADPGLTRERDGETVREYRVP